MSEDRWPFTQARNTAAFMTSQVLKHREAILLVVHDEDGEWQFIGSTDGTAENCRVVCLHDAVDLDCSILDLADLPLGWHAVRDSVETAWTREADPDTTPLV